jgi:hypothetical protein
MTLGVVTEEELFENFVSIFGVINILLFIIEFFFSILLFILFFWYKIFREVE